MTNWCYPALCGDLWRARGCGILTASHNFIKNEAHNAANVMSLRRTVTQEVTMRPYSHWILAQNPLFATHLFSTSHNTTVGGAA